MLNPFGTPPLDGTDGGKLSDYLNHLVSSNAKVEYPTYSCYVSIRKQIVESEQKRYENKYPLVPQTRLQRRRNLDASQLT